MKLFKTIAFVQLLCFQVRAMAQNNTIELAIMNSVEQSYGQFYYANITVGTPGQLQTVLVDTGSSTTIFLAPDATLSNKSSNFSHTFNPLGSETFKTVHPGALEALYGNLWSMLGDFVSDVVQMGDIVVSDVQVGLAHDINWGHPPYTGMLGLGYSSREGIDFMMQRRKKVPNHPSLIETLVKAKAISSRLFSIYLNTLDHYGSILFGGVDTAKYKNPLTTLNCLNDEGVVNNWDLTLQEVTMQPYGGPNQTLLRSTKDRPLTTLPDTGTPDWQLPTSAYYKVIGYAGVQRLEDIYEGADPQTFVRPCSDVAYGIVNTTRFQLTLSGNGTNSATLDFELADLFKPITTKAGASTTDEDGQPLCQLQVAEVPEDASFMITSGSVMRAGYWVFDLDNGQISVGQANLRANSSNVVQVQAGADGLSRAAGNVAEVQKDLVEGQMSVPGTWHMSTATKTIGYTTGPQNYPTPTGITRDADRFVGDDSPL
ncbi:acid protease [Aureobasidium pullulans EXF-150]|uniref:Acid protease n=1 Tax=Aureobasidium pullulans EXF-150 TaxID=1043002 RepID=A0A074Y0W8_AURPU|nr:acid protease [Aureobasidium pullulans EXF-150]KEQ89549.1 acid protease [Aureobasidium pullulans EXF-150]